MGPGSMRGMRPTLAMSSTPNSVLGGTVMVRVLVRVSPLWVKAMGRGRLRLRADSSRICSQLGLETRLKRVMMSPAAMPAVAAADALGNVVDDGGAGEVLVDFVVVVGDEEEQDEGDEEVGDGAGEGDEDTLPAGLGGEVVGRASWAPAATHGSAVSAEFAGEFDVAADGEEGDAVVGIAVTEAEEAGTEADGEGFDANAAELGDDEMAELVNEDEEAEDDGEFNDDDGDMHADYAGTLWEKYRQDEAKTFLCSG